MDGQQPLVEQYCYLKKQAEEFQKKCEDKRKELLKCKLSFLFINVKGFVRWNTMINAIETIKLLLKLFIGIH